MFNKSKLMLAVALTGVFSAAASADQVIVYTQVTGNGQIMPERAELRSGDSHQLFVSPAEGYEVKHVSGCNGIYEFGTYQIASVTANCMVKVEFAQLSESYDPLKRGAGQDKNSTDGSSGGLVDGKSASTLSTSSTGGTGTGTGGTGGGSRKGSGNLLLLLIASDVATNFVDVTARVVGSGGSISPATQKVRLGTSATINVTPSSGFKVAALQGCGLASTQAGAVLTPAITAACGITVTFERLATAVWDNFTWDNAVWG